MNNKGISVISLVVTIIVLVLISSITIYNGANMVTRSRERMAMDRLQTVANSIIAHEDELGYGRTVLGGSVNDFTSINLSGTPDDMSDDLLIRIEADNSITTHEITDDVYMQVGSGDYEKMGLSNFSDTSNMPPIFFIKAPNYDNEEEFIYEYKTPKYVKKSGIYEEEDFIYYISKSYSKIVKTNYKMEFDENRGVNRPLLADGMTPVIMHFASNDYERVNPTIVEDIYRDDWYNYTKDSPMWANVMLKTTDSYNIANRYYVWIPRFAYKIQDLYKGANFPDIPSSAIDIVFLRENKDYISNNQVLPTGFQVHPAFKYKLNDKEVNISGFWISKDYVAVVDSLLNSGSSDSSAEEVTMLSNLHPELTSDPSVSSHILKNTEWAAVAYLSLYYIGRTSDNYYLGNSLGSNASGVMNLNVETFVAGGLKSVIESQLPYADLYDVNDGRMTYWSYESSNEDPTQPPTYNKTQRKFGDALCATSKNDGTTVYGSWFGGQSIPIDETLPYITRGQENNMFSYGATSNSGISAACRNVLIVESN